jgi:ribonuclease Z
MRKSLWLAGGIVAVALAAAFLSRDAIGGFLFDRAVGRGAGSDALANLPDGLHVGLCGTGSPLPDAKRAGPCTFVRAGKRLFLVDVGGGAVRRLGEMHVQLGQVERIFLTHFHSDHIDGLGEAMLMRWTGSGQSNPIPVHAGLGVDQVVEGFNSAYALDAGYRVQHHGPKTVPPAGRGGIAMPFTLADGAETAVIFEEGGVRVTAIKVRHDPVTPAFGYRIDYAGRSVVISGDTAKAEQLARACNGCDLMVHEALNPQMVRRIEDQMKTTGNARLAKIMSDIPGYHASPVEAAQTARAGRAQMLVLTHIVPATPISSIEAYFMRGVSDAFSGKALLGRDGLLISMPAKSRAISTRDLL